MIIKNLKYFAMLLAVVFLTACTTTRPANNHLDLMSVVHHFSDSGLEVVQIQGLVGSPLRAEGGVAMLIGESEIGVYKYNTKVEKQLRNLEFVEKNGFVYVQGQKFPALINGSFVAIGYEKHPQKQKIIEAMESFK